jgi:arginase family enzyme
MGFTILNGPLDPDEREAYIVRKIEACREGYTKVPFRDPAEGMVRELQIKGEVERIEAEPWLTPTPPPEMLFMLTVENFVTFVDSNGCLDYSNAMKERIRSGVLPEVPVIFGVDHSLSGGAIEAVADEYGGENLRLVVFDSHLDFIPPSIRCGLIQYDVETNPDTKFAPNDPYIFNRQDSYNADSFLNFLIKKVPPENVLVVGVSDYPPRVAEEIEDDRVRRYLEFYKGVEASGVRVIKKDEIRSDSASVKTVLSKTDKSFTYVSVDVDVCANTSLRGARFLNYHGLSHSGLYGLSSALGGSLRKSKLVGLDFMEFDVIRAGALISGKVDRTYQIMAEVFRRLMIPHHTRQ